MNLYLWTDGPHRGAWNMAIDEAMAVLSERRQAAYLRLYWWSEPTLSLGYFQKQSDRLNNSQLIELPYTRRLSGGGGIVHHRELTYSLAMPVQDSSKSAQQQLYCSVHQSVTDAVSGLGYDLQTAGCLIVGQPSLRRSEEPFLCFERRANVDLLMGQAKIVGSAQRRLGAVVLQHGSILLDASPFTNHLLGLMQFERTIPIRENNMHGLQAESRLELSDMREHLIDGLRRIIGDQWKKSDSAVAAIAQEIVLQDREEIRENAAELCERKYDCVSWVDQK